MVGQYHETSESNPNRVPGFAEARRRLAARVGEKSPVKSVRRMQLLAIVIYVVVSLFASCRSVAVDANGADASKEKPDRHPARSTALREAPTAMGNNFLITS